MHGCTRWPGSDGRKIGMRLLRRWYTADIAWVRGTKPQEGVAEEPRWLVGFALPVPLGDTHRLPHVSIFFSLDVVLAQM